MFGIVDIATYSSNSQLRLLAGDEVSIHSEMLGMWGVRFLGSDSALMFVDKSCISISTKSDLAIYLEMRSILSERIASSKQISSRWIRRSELSTYGILATRSGLIRLQESGLVYRHGRLYTLREPLAIGAYVSPDLSDFLSKFNRCSVGTIPKHRLPSALVDFEVERSPTGWDVSYGELSVSSGSSLFDALDSFNLAYLRRLHETS